MVATAPTPRPGAAISMMCNDSSRAFGVLPPLRSIQGLSCTARTSLPTQWEDKTGDVRSLIRRPLWDQGHGKVVKLGCDLRCRNNG